MNRHLNNERQECKTGHVEERALVGREHTGGYVFDVLSI
jgi:hypothetical protein